jgi:hypothetical protein
MDRGGSRDPCPRQPGWHGKERFAAKGQGEILERFEEAAPAVANLARSMPTESRQKPGNLYIYNQLYRLPGRVGVVF